MTDETAYPPCYGREWDPTEAQVCGVCEVQQTCSHIFALQRLDEAAKTLHLPSPQSAPAQKLATFCGTSVEAINRARALRFELSTAPLQPLTPTPLVVVPGLAVDPTSPAELSELSVVPTPEVLAPTSASAGKRTGRPRKKKLTEEVRLIPPSEPIEADVEELRAAASKLGLEVAAPVKKDEAGIGHVVNLTTGEVSLAEWPGFPALFRTPGGTQSIMQLVFWSSPLNAWVWLVAETTGRPVPVGVIEMTWRQWVDAGFEQQLKGTDPGAALRQIAGL